MTWTKQDYSKITIDKFDYLSDENIMARRFLLQEWKNTLGDFIAFKPFTIVGSEVKRLKIKENQNVFWLPLDIKGNFYQKTGREILLSKPPNSIHFSVLISELGISVEQYNSLPDDNTHTHTHTRNRVVWQNYDYI